MRIGIADKRFDSLPPDLVSTFTRWSPPAVIPDAALADSGKTHGHGVAGIIAAEGDNFQGMAGMVWGAELDLFAFDTTGYVSANSVDYMGKVFATAANRGDKVLNLSFGLGDAGEPGVVASIQTWMSVYLNSGPDRLVVLATGNNGLTVSIDSVASATGAPFSALDRVAAILSKNATFAHKVLFVTGTKLTGARHPGTNIWTGTDIIAAPAESILTLSGPSGQMVFQDSSSFAAPFATGLAAQLWSMSPSLTAPEVVDFIRRGAQVARIDPTTGLPVPRPDIGVAGVYQLDAYGSLSLLSKERSGTPICGYPVWYGPNEEVALLRNGLASPEEIGPTGLLSTNVSVAQGGRQIAITAYEPTPTAIGELYYGALQNGLWSWSLIPGRQYLETWSFLEQDTMMQKGTALASTALTLIGPGRPGARGPALSSVDLFQLPSVLGSGGQYAGGDVVLVSPDGRWAMIALVKFVGSTLVRGTYLVKLADFSAVPISEAPDGDPSDIIIRTWAWSHDGTKFLGSYEPNGVPDHSAIYRLVDVTATTAVVRVPDVVATGKRVAPISLTFSIEDAVIYGEEVDLATPSNCIPVQRRISDLVVTQNLGQFGNSTCMGQAIPQANLMAGNGSARRDTLAFSRPHTRRRTPVAMPQPIRRHAN